MPKIVYLQKLELYDLQLVDGFQNLSHERRFGKKPSDKFMSSEYFHFPLIVNENGALWRDGNLYLLDFLKRFSPPSYKTLHSIAGDLRAFLDWSQLREIDYLYSEGSRFTLAPARFSRFLRDESQLAESTATRRMLNVQKFYSWLMGTNRIAVREYWIETIHYSQHRKRSSDLVKALRQNKVLNSNPNTIQDGGSLRPLSVKEQKALFLALKKIDNIEMTLAFQLAASTGARKQSVFTFRKKNFLTEVCVDDKYVIQTIGGKSGVDTKFDVQMALPIPIWLYRSIQLYLAGEKSLRRQIFSKHKYQNPAEDYAFLTSRSNAFYISKFDENISSYSNPPRGSSVDQFIRNQLKPKLNKMGFDFKFNFHDLRATYGVNLVNFLTKSLTKDAVLNENSSEFLHILEFVKNRMGHKHIKTTLKYLRFPSDRDMLFDSQIEFEKYLTGGED